MMNLTDEDIISAINSQRMADNLLSYIMIGLWIICIGFCIFETVIRVLAVRSKKNSKVASDAYSKAMNNEGSIEVKKESYLSTLESFLPWFGDLIILLLSSAIGVGGVIIVIINNQPVSYSIEEKYVAKAEMYYFENEIRDNTHNDKSDWSIKTPKKLIFIFLYLYVTIMMHLKT